MVGSPTLQIDCFRERLSVPYRDMLNRWFLQERWGGHILVKRERVHAVTVACGSFQACCAAQGLFMKPFGVVVSNARAAAGV